MTLTGRYIYVSALLSGSVAVGACGNRAAQAPTPPAYVWPDHFAYRERLYRSVSGSGRGAGAELAATTRFAVRDAQYVATRDSVVRVVSASGAAPRREPLTLGDTVGFYVSLGRRGEITRLQLDCDPAVPACAAAPPSCVLLELRRMIPRLPVFEAPRGATWVDTLVLDDQSRAGGRHGLLVTQSAGRGDTVVAGRRFWVIAWRAEGEAAAAGGPLEKWLHETGMALVGKSQLVPAYAEWTGLGAPEHGEPAGSRPAAYRGRAWLVESVFDSLSALGAWP